MSINKSGKIWGMTELLISHPTFEIHRIEANKSGFCSKHKHEYRYNMFYVESGKMLIRVWQNDYDLCDTTILEPGDQISVPPNIMHQFEALEDTIAFEIYYVERLDKKDIVRESVGGTRNPPRFPPPSP